MTLVEPATRVQPPTPRTGVSLSLDGVTRRFDDLVALGPVDLQVTAGSFVAVVGPSGCGKSTLLRLLAGLDEPSTGLVHVDTTTPDQLRRQRRIGWLAQHPALLPWLDVHANVAMAGRIHGEDLGDRVDDLLTRVGLDGFGDHLPHELSGGMRQRVGLARTMALQAPLWLMDEPLAALDELTRDRTANDLVAMWQQQRPTVMWVTHHLGEAVALADRILVLSARPGRIVADLQVTTPRPRDITSQDHQALVRHARAALADGPHTTDAIRTDEVEVAGVPQ